jgi:predicted nucleic acid-binding protein
MRIRAYIDTNIYIYVAIRNIKYFDLCKEILKDVMRGNVEAYGSSLVAIEILGSLSKIDPFIANEALKSYLSMPIKDLEITEEVLLIAAYLNMQVNLRYDAVHAALAIKNNIPNIITNDVDDFKRVKDNFNTIIESLKRVGIKLELDRINIITPDTYPESLG